MCLGAITQLSCGFLGVSAAVAAAVSCPDLFNDKVDPLTVKYSQKADLNAQVAAFVAATHDLFEAAAQVETEAREACLRMGRDIGLKDQDMAPAEGVSGSVVGACGAVAKRIEQILASGIRLEVSIKPPKCKLNAQLETACTGSCRAAAESSQCRASCQARAELGAECSLPAVKVKVRGKQAKQAKQLVATLRANLPKLLYAQIALGKRAARQAKVLIDIGSSLPTIIKKAGDKSVKCVAAAAGTAALAATSIGVVIDASANVSVKAGAKKQ